MEHTRLSPKIEWCFSPEPGPAGLRWYGRTLLKEGAIQLNLPEIQKLCATECVDLFWVSYLVFIHELLHWQNPSIKEKEVHFALKTHLEKEGRQNLWAVYAKLLQ